MIDSFYWTAKSSYHQVFSEECEYAVKEKKDGWVYQWQLGISSSDLDGENSNEENQVYIVFSFHIFHV